jgi:hypothetical protein
MPWCSDLVAHAVSTLVLRYGMLVNPNNMCGLVVGLQKGSPTPTLQMRSLKCRMERGCHGQCPLTMSYTTMKLYIAGWG